MASSLRAKLAQMSSASPETKPKQLVQLAPMTYVEHARVADPRLYALSDVALARIGFDADWPGIERCLFLDTETTGLSRGAGTIAFMIGLGYVRDGAFLIEQHMVGDYPDEPLMMAKLAALIKDFDVVVSFNGKAFDVPLLETRAVMCRMPPLFEDHLQLDLLHPSRRLWKRRLGSCRLGNLEACILGSGRTDDLPGSEAPARFFKYLETGDLSLLDDVLHHNMLDIESLGALLIALCEAYESPNRLQELPDLYSMGRAMERRGERDVAEQCYMEAARPRAARSMRDLHEDQYTGEAALALSMMKKRQGEWTEAERLWAQLSRRGQMGAVPHVELAKLYEHRLNRPREALEAAEKALEMEADPAKRAEIEHRVERLRAKQYATARAVIRSASGGPSSN